MKKSESETRTSSKQPLFRPSERFQLESDSPVPLYHQMERIVLERIQKRGEIGGAIPTEMDLMKIFGVSRGTVKKMTEQLASKGLIEKKRAIGSKILRLPITEDLGRLRSYSEQMALQGLAIRTRVVASRFIKPNATIRRQLKLTAEEKVLSIERLRGTSGHYPIVYLHSHIPQHWGIQPQDNFEGSLYQIIEKKHAIPIGWAEETISARGASAREADLLGVNIGHTVLVMERLTFQKDELPLEFVRAVYNAEHYNFSIRLKR